MAREEYFSRISEGSNGHFENSIVLIERVRVLGFYRIKIA